MGTESMKICKTLLSSIIIVENFLFLVKIYFVFEQGGYLYTRNQIRTVMIMSIGLKPFFTFE